MPCDIVGNNTWDTLLHMPPFWETPVPIPCNILIPTIPLPTEYMSLEDIAGLALD